jgi:hypothetical protein
MPVLEVQTIEPAALSPKGAGSYLSLTERQIYNLIADEEFDREALGVADACRFPERQKILRIVTVQDGIRLDTERASVRQCGTIAPSYP